MFVPQIMTLNSDKCKLGMCCYTKNVFSQSTLEISQILAILTSVKIGGGNKGGEGCFILFDTLCKNTRVVWTLFGVR